jgi:hypothetical protein
MSFEHHAGNLRPPRIVSAETMYKAIMDVGIVPFMSNAIPGYSIEEMTAPEYWFDGDAGVLGPWDWKIDMVQSGDIVYGKFLGGKAAYATVPWYRELRAWRRGTVISSEVEKSHASQDAAIMDFIDQNGAITIKEVRALLGVKKGAADAAITRLQMQCRVVTGDLIRVYRGEDLHYSGWQVASFTTPEALYGAPDLPFASVIARPTIYTDGSPTDSLERLLAHMAEVSGCSDRKKLLKLIG